MRTPFFCEKRRNRANLNEKQPGGYFTSEVFGAVKIKIRQK